MKFNNSIKIQELQPKEEIVAPVQLLEQPTAREQTPQMPSSQQQAPTPIPMAIPESLN